jgi:hypothetical protein
MTQAGVNAKRRNSKLTKYRKMIETGILKILPLTYSQLIKYAKCDNSLERELHLKEARRIIPDELKEALEKTIISNVADRNKKLFIFNTLDSDFER